ncbi:hypothetical protein ACQ4M4_09540 [Leptolyngbya sp. AN02str]|uniref:hypothetical protein n=1 Tax=Leptolyngbya sp. AN02str TaxID=3423363 RepID=UPI003D31FF80
MDVGCFASYIHHKRGRLDSDERSHHIRIHPPRLPPIPKKLLGHSAINSQPSTAHGFSPPDFNHFEKHQSIQFPCSPRFRPGPNATVYRRIAPMAPTVYPSAKEMELNLP